MWYASVETNSGEKLKLLRSDGFPGGKAFLAFLIPLENYCDTNAEKPDNQPLKDWFEWFTQLDNNADHSLAEITKALRQSWYVGEWNYLETDYELYRLHTSNLDLSPAEFIRTMEDLETKWTDAKKVLESINSILQLLINTSPGPVDGLFNPSDTLPDLWGLHDALEILVKRKAEKVRIQIL